MSKKSVESRAAGKDIKKGAQNADSPDSDANSDRYSNIDLEWREQYNTGVAEIDYQHRYFLGSIKRIASFMASKKDHPYCQRLLMELVYYTKFHFYSEENLMMHCKYPEIREHQKLHLDLIDLLTNEVNLMAENMDEYHQFIQFLLKWFVHHSMEEDKRFATFLKNR